MITPAMRPAIVEVLKFMMSQYPGRVREKKVHTSSDVARQLQTAFARCCARRELDAVVWFEVVVE